MGSTKESGYLVDIGGQKQLSDKVLSIYCNLYFIDNSLWTSENWDYVDNIAYCSLTTFTNRFSSGK
jgi:hypothetical protein